MQQSEPCVADSVLISAGTRAAHVLAWLCLDLTLVAEVLGEMVTCSGQPLELVGVACPPGARERLCTEQAQTWQLSWPAQVRSQSLLVVNLLLRPSDSAMVKSNGESQQGVITESGGQPYVCRCT